MKKLIALLMAFVLPFTTICSAAQQAVRLPKRLKTIEDEAFAYTQQVEEVYIPWGTESIGSRAFAYSGLSKVYIPATVSYIADDAFEGTSLTIITPDLSYAREYADKHGLVWEDGTKIYRDDRVTSMIEMLENEELTGSIIADPVNLAEVSTEGITDAEELARVEDHNAWLTEYEKASEQYAAECDKLVDLFTQLDESIAKVGLTTTDGSIRMELDDFSYTISSDVMRQLGTDYEVTSVETAADGSIVVDAVKNGVTYHLVSNMSGMTVNSVQPALLQRGRYVRNLAASARNSADILDQISALLGEITQIISTTKMVLESALAAADAEIITLQAELRRKPVDALTGNYEEMEAALASAKINKALLENLGKVFSGLSIATALGTITEDIIKVGLLNSLDEHGHPIPDIPLDEERSALIEQMNIDIDQARMLYITDIIVNMLDVVAEIAGFLGVATAVVPGSAAIGASAKAVIILLEGLLKVVFVDVYLSWLCQEKYDAAFAADDKLHSFIYGKVTDEETGEAVPDTAVTNGWIAVRADADGMYRIYLLPGEISLLFRAEDYEEKTVDVQLSAREECEQDVELTPDPSGAKVFGVITAKETGELLEGVQVVCGENEMYTDAAGSYCFEELEPGEYTISCAKHGYADWEATIQLEEEQELEFNIALDSCYLISNREELEAIANDVMGNYTLVNDIDLSEEPWTPLPWFSGTLDGAGFSINGMQISTGTEDYVGLFSGLYNGHVSNLYMHNPTINLTVNGGFVGVGMICGGLNNDSSLTNCSVSGTINVTSAAGNTDLFVGGLAGYSDHGYITDCYSNADVTAVTPNTVHAGGLAGMLRSGQAKNSDANGSISVVQSGSNARARLNAFGTLYSAGTPAENCNASGSVTAQSTNGSANAYGVTMSNNSTNSAGVSAGTENGEAAAFGYYDGVGGENTANVMATATGSGSVTARGLERVSDSTNSGNVSASAVSGNVMAAGAQDAGADVKNTGSISAQSVSGDANAHGVFGLGSSSTGCSNSGTVTSTTGTKQALAIGVQNCASSENRGRVSATSTRGTAVGQGMTLCTGSTNYGDVDVIYKGEDGMSGGLSAHGLNACTNSTNVGSVSGRVEDSSTICVVTGVKDGSGNINQGSVEAVSDSGLATARGVWASDSQNYGSVMAESKSDKKGAGSNATAYGVGEGVSNSFNGGDVTAISRSSVAYAYGTGGGEGCSSTGSVSAEAQLFYEEETEDGAWGEIGRAFASNSLSTQVTIAGCSVSASGGQTRNVYYFIAGSSCSDHKDMTRQFVSYDEGDDEELDDCFVPVGSASSSGD